MDKVKFEISQYVSTLESQVSHDMCERDPNVDVRFTTWGHRAAGKAIFEIFEMLPNEEREKIMTHMKGRRVEI